MKSETTYHAILGQILKSMRTEQGMDQVEIADKMDMNRASWSRIENGATIVNIKQLQKIAEIFNLEANEILMRADKAVDTLKAQGHLVHYDSAKEVEAKSSGSKKLAFMGGAVLGLLVGGLLATNTKDDKEN